MPRRRHTGAAPGAAADGAGGGENRHGGKTKPPYPPAFREEAVRLARSGGAPLVQIARDLGISQDTLRVQEIRRTALVPSSIDSAIGEDEEARLSDLIEDRSTVPPDAEVDRSELRVATRQTLHKTLSEREQLVVELRYGLVDGERQHLEKIGERLGLTRERVRQIEARALEKLRASRDARRLLTSGAA